MNLVDLLLLLRPLAVNEGRHEIAGKPHAFELAEGVLRQLTLLEVFLRKRLQLRLVNITNLSGLGGAFDCLKFLGCLAAYLLLEVLIRLGKSFG